jgi:hypothetical protein
LKWLQLRLGKTCIVDAAAIPILSSMRPGLQSIPDCCLKMHRPNLDGEVSWPRPVAVSDRNTADGAELEYQQAIQNSSLRYTLGSIAAINIDIVKKASRTPVNLLVLHQQSKGTGK